MSRIAYVNGRYLRHDEAGVHIEDRGYQFADGVYEACEIWNGMIVDERMHLDRLERSLRELALEMPVARAALKVILREIIARNRVHDGLIYLQVTRGVAKRDHVFPPPGTPPALVVTARRTSRVASDKLAEEGVSVITLPDNRWDRVDIKTISLLPNAIARQKAKEAGAKEAWFTDADGFVTEGAATTAWIVTREGTLVTRPDGTGILPGITRRTAAVVAKKQRLAVEERKFTVDEAHSAREVFMTSASTVVMPIVEIDGKPIANGRPGSIATALRAAFHNVAELS